MSAVLWYVLWFVVAVALLGVVLAMFVHDVGRLSRREPLKIPFIGEARPGDATYPLAVMELFGPYLTLCTAIAFIVGFSVYVAVFAGS